MIYSNCCLERDSDVNKLPPCLMEEIISSLLYELYNSATTDEYTNMETQYRKT